MERVHTSPDIPVKASTLTRSPLPCQDAPVMSVSRGAPGAEARLKRLGITLPVTPTPVANYVRAVQSGRLLFLAGHLPAEEGRVITGKLGLELSVEDGYRAARVRAAPP